ncbi:RICIN domain-containing protein [Streptomyces alanosinicus]|nr:RICIN domain-containing protein [Streptomyces alanosinicus]
MTLTRHWRQWGVVALAGVLLAASGTGSAAARREQGGEGEVHAYAVDPPNSWYENRCLYHGYDESPHLPKLVENVVMTCGTGDTWHGIGKTWTATKYGQLVSGYDQAARQYLCLDAAAPHLEGWAGDGDSAVVDSACDNGDAQKWSFADNRVRNNDRCLAAGDDADNGWWKYWGFSTISVVARDCSADQSRLTWKTPAPAGPEEQPEICRYIPDDNDDVSPRACFMWASAHHSDVTSKDYIFESPDKWSEQAHDHAEHRKRDVQEADVTLIVSVQEFGSAAEHIRHATTAHPDTAILTIDRSTADATQRRRQTTRLIRQYRRDHSVAANQDVDEWPMAMFAEGGESPVLSLMAIDRESNRSLGAAIANALDGANPADTAWWNNARVRFVVVDTIEQADNLAQALRAQDDQRNRADAVRVLSRVITQQAEQDNRTYLQDVTAGLRQQINNAGVGMTALGAFAVHSFGQP